MLVYLYCTHCAIGTVSPGSVSHQLGSLMDWFSTALDLAGIKEPEDRVIDGISLRPLLVNGTHTDRFGIQTVLLCCPIEAEKCLRGKVVVICVSLQSHILLPW